MLYSTDVTPKRFERLTDCLEGSCSIQLSYGVNTLFQYSEAIGTLDRPAPKGGMLYPTELRSQKENPLSNLPRGLMSGWQDSNLRPPGPKPGAMTGLRYTPPDNSGITIRGEGGIRTLGTV
jgi:hypothetical protein